MLNSAHQSILGNSLYNACKSGDLSVVKTLLDKETLSSSKVINSLFITAAAYDREEIAEWCLSQGAKVTDEMMWQLMGSAASKVHKLLISTNAVDINYYAETFGDALRTAVFSGNRSWASFCLEHGADPNRYNASIDRSILAMAAQRESIEILELLLQYNAQLRSSGAIVLAAGAGRTDVVRFLIDKDANINEASDFKYERSLMDNNGTALHRAAAAGHKDTVQLLLEKGADATLKDVKGRKPWELVAEGSYRNEILKMLGKYSLTSEDS